MGDIKDFYNCKKFNKNLTKQDQSENVNEKPKKIIQKLDIKERRSDRRYYKNTCSYDVLEEKGWQFSNNYDVYTELEKQEYEKHEYEGVATQKYLEMLRRAIKDNLYKFTPYQRIIIKMRFGQNLSIADLAKKFNVSKGAMQSYLSRIQAKISKFLK